MVNLILTTITSILAEIVVIVCGFILKKNSNCQINNWFGYRTSRSMSSREAWVFANKLCAKILIYGGITASIVSCAVILALYFIFGAEVAIGASIIINCVVAVMCVIVIPYVESKLKKFLAKENNNDQN